MFPCHPSGGDAVPGPTELSHIFSRVFIFINTTTISSKVFSKCRLLNRKQDVKTTDHTVYRQINVYFYFSLDEMLP
jgi:hypothetical protein